MAQTQEELLEEQKKQCVFCRVVNGEFASKKVFENDAFLAILDIRPAAQGHVLLLPKEHVPILQLLPEKRLHEAFTLVAELSAAVRDAITVKEVSVCIASGAAAGQQAPHALIHIIPREPGDGLDMLDLGNRTVRQADTLALSGTFQEAIRQMLAHLKREDLLVGGAIPVTKSIEPVPVKYEEAPREAPPAEAREPVPEGAEEFATTNDALQAALVANPDLRRLIIAEPALVETYISRSENLKKLFEGVNVRALSLMLRKQEERQKDARGERQRAADMTEEALFAFIDGNEGLRTWLLNHPEELAANIRQNPRLQAFFEGIDIVMLAARYRAYRGDG